MTHPGQLNPAGRGIPTGNTNKASLLAQIDVVIDHGLIHTRIGEDIPRFRQIAPRNVAALEPLKNRGYQLRLASHIPSIGSRTQAPNGAAPAPAPPETAAQEPRFRLPHRCGTPADQPKSSIEQTRSDARIHRRIPNAPHPNKRTLRMCADTPSPYCFRPREPERAGGETQRSAREPSERGPRRGPATSGFQYAPRGTRPVRRR